MKLNKGQEECLKRLQLWWENRDSQVFEISGAAGTGKTTIVLKLLEAIGLSKKNVAFMALSGKAAVVLSRTGVNARTIHSTIYDCIDTPRLDKNGNVITYMGKNVYCKKFILKPQLGEDIKLIVIDEASMVDEKLAQDILSFNLPILALGDLNQLPPVQGSHYFLKRPDFVLTEIMRQNKDNPIIWLSQEIINNRIPNREFKLDTGVYVLKKHNVEPMEIYKHMDMVLCGRNRTRDSINRDIRIYKAREDESPVIGDKIICRQNVWDRCVKDIFLVNGLIGYITDMNMESFKKHSILIDFVPEFSSKDIDSTFEDVKMDWDYIKMSYDKKKNSIQYDYSRIRFEYAYCITTHLSQGSQYDRVAIFNERFGNFDFYKKWLYTAVTRAISQLVLLI